MVTTSNVSLLSVVRDYRSKLNSFFIVLNNLFKYYLLYAERLNIIIIINHFDTLIMFKMLHFQLKFVLPTYYAYWVLIVSNVK